ncbi:MAG TPA: NAD(P)-dependent oxidoreductase [Pseudomonadales bacterium]
MKVLVTGSAGHLGEALMRVLRERPGFEPIGLDRLESPTTDIIGSILDPEVVEAGVAGVQAILHTATLHKPHIGSHSPQAFVDVNVSGTLRLLEAAVAARVQVFVFTSTTSAFGNALRPPPDRPAVWVTEALAPVPRNVYGVTKAAAEDVCQLFHQDHGLPCLVLRTSRFFPEEDDDPAARGTYSADNLKVNELLYRRVDLADVVDAHLLALERAARIGFGRFIISATTPLEPEDAGALRRDLPSVLDRRVPGWRDVYGRLDWAMLPGIDRVYDNRLAREVLGWQPRHDFTHALRCLAANRDHRSALAVSVGYKGYHREPAARQSEAVKR